jgi:hypothetical protein
MVTRLNARIVKPLQWTKATVIDPIIFRVNKGDNNTLILLHQNIRGLVSKKNEVIASLTLDKINPHFLCFSEHHTADNNLSFVSSDNYVLGSCYSRCMYQKGGVCIYVRNELCFSQVDLLTYYLEKIL